MWTIEDLANYRAQLARTIRRQEQELVAIDDQIARMNAQQLNLRIFSADDEEQLEGCGIGLLDVATSRAA